MQQLNPFVNPIDTSQLNTDLEFLRLQLEAMRELANSPKLLQYIITQGQSVLYDIATEQIAGADPHRLHTVIANLQGSYEVYKHLHDLVTSLPVIEETYINKTRGV